jgi:hypothetical protein
MHDIKLPGCFVSDDLLAKLQSETVDEHIELASQQVAMYRSIGYSGVDIGGVHDYDVFLKILNRADEIGDNWEQYKDNLCWADEIGDNWEQYKDNLCWPADNPFYLYNDAGDQMPLSYPRKKFNERFFDFMHRAILDADHRGFRCFKGLMKFIRADREDSVTNKAFNAVEKSRLLLA